MLNLSGNTCSYYMKGNMNLVVTTIFIFALSDLLLLRSWIIQSPYFKELDCNINSDRGTTHIKIKTV